MRLTVCVGADIAPTEANIDLFCTDGAALMGDSLRKRWFAADVRIANLELPLTDGGAPIEKCGPHMRAPKACAKGLKALRTDGLGLANNHILDFGAEGLTDTVAALSEQGIESFGAGTAKQADEPFILVRNGVRLGIYGVCEHEYSAAEGDRLGANALDLLEIADRIRQIKAGCDRLIVLYHGGREHYPYPSPRLRKLCRKLADCGADAVLCQHSHCVGSAETYHGAVIVYGQGNFIFDVPDGEAGFQTGLLVSLTFDDGDVKAEYLPLVRQNGRTQLAEGARAKEILDGFAARSEEIAEEGFAQRAYRQYAVSVNERMLRVFLGGNVVLRALCVLHGRRPSRVYDRKTLLGIKNSLRCESINELLTEGLE